MKTHPLTMVVLSCLHTAYFQKPAPNAGERVYCMRCGDYKDVAEAPHDFRVHCLACTYAKHAGNAQVTAETSAGNHAIRRPGHRVVLADGELIVREYIHTPVPLTDTPPF